MTTERNHDLPGGIEISDVTDVAAGCEMAVQPKTTSKRIRLNSRSLSDREIDKLKTTSEV